MEIITKEAKVGGEYQEDSNGRGFMAYELRVHVSHGHLPVQQANGFDSMTHRFEIARDAFIKKKKKFKEAPQNAKRPMASFFPKEPLPPLLEAGFIIVLAVGASVVTKKSESPPTLPI